MPDVTYEPYYPDGWDNAPDTATPITAAALNAVDAGIAAATDQANAALDRDAVPGPTGATGATGATGPRGPTGYSDAVTIPVTIPSVLWRTTHSFPYLPAVITRDTSGAIIIGDVGYPDGITVTVSWAGMQTGSIEMM